jgi:hypothetical protein
LSGWRKGTIQPITPVDPMVKGLPANVDAERFVLGQVLLNDTVYLEVAGTIGPNDFSLEKHCRLFARMKDLYDRAEHIDRVTLADELMKRGQLESVDGLAYLVSLDEGLPEIPNLDSYIRIVKEKATLRKLIFSGQSLINRCLIGDDGPREIVESHLTCIEDLRANLYLGSSERIENLPNPADTRDSFSYVTKPELPERCLVGLTGPSGEGKSTISTAWARNAIAAGRPVLILDRENPQSIVADRMKRLGMTGGGLLHWWGGWLGREAPEPGAAGIHDWVRSRIAHGPLPLVIVDSLAAFEVGDENSAADMRRFMHQCRRLADLGATVIVIHHDGKAESAKDFRGSSDFKASIDQAFHCTNIGSDGKLDRLTLRCFKSRYGLSGSLIYHYAGGRIVRDERQDAPERSIADRLTTLLRQNPGIGSREFEDHAAKQSLGRQKARDFLANGVLSRVIRRENASRNRFRHYLRDDEPGAE